MATFNVINFRKETQRARNSFKNIARNAAIVRLNSIYDNTLKNFEKSEITQEIDAGPTASNISKTLGGRGNLFSYIGFLEGSDPLRAVREALESIGMQDGQPVILENESLITFKFAIRRPTLKDLYDITPMPWEEGVSWLRGIEKGISGLSNYIYWKVLPNPPSRSSTGVQAENELRGAVFTPKQYMSVILRDLDERLEN